MLFAIRGAVFVKHRASLVGDLIDVGIELLPVKSV